jgi:hypothetical protein
MVALEPTTRTVHTLPYAPRIRENVAEMSRLINAALVDQSFCSRLLSEPASAIENGYNGEKFSLSSLETEFVFSVKANSLTDFAIRWTKFSTDMISTAEYMDVMIPIRN